MICSILVVKLYGIVYKFDIEIVIKRIIEKIIGLVLY